jgi:hypothetical protein
LRVIANIFLEDDLSSSSHLNLSGVAASAPLSFHAIAVMRKTTSMLNSRLWDLDKDNIVIAEANWTNLTNGGSDQFIASRQINLSFEVPAFHPKTTTAVPSSSPKANSPSSSSSGGGAMMGADSKIPSLITIICYQTNSLSSSSTSPVGTAHHHHPSSKQQSPHHHQQQPVSFGVRIQTSIISDPAASTSSSSSSCPIICTAIALKPPYQIKLNR